MKKIMYVVLGFLLLAPAMVMAQQIDEAAIEKAMVAKGPSHAEAAAMSMTLIMISKGNRMFADAYKIVAMEVVKGELPSFEAMDLLGMSFDTLRDPYNIKTVGEKHAQVEEQYKKNVYGILDGFFAGTGMTLAEIAEQVQQKEPHRTLKNIDIFKTMDGTLAGGILDEIRAARAETEEE